MRRTPTQPNWVLARLLDDGLPFSQVAEYLLHKGHPVSEDSIGSWKNGGYQNWLRQQRFLEESRLRHEFTLSPLNRAIST